MANLCLIYDIYMQPTIYNRWSLAKRRAVAQPGVYPGTARKLDGTGGGGAIAERMLKVAVRVRWAVE